MLAFFLFTAASGQVRDTPPATEAKVFYFEQDRFTVRQITTGGLRRFTRVSGGHGAWAVYMPIGVDPQSVDKNYNLLKQWVNQPLDRDSFSMEEGFETLYDGQAVEPAPLLKRMPRDIQRGIRWMSSRPEWMKGTQIARLRARTRYYALIDNVIRQGVELRIVSKGKRGEATTWLAVFEDKVEKAASFDRRYEIKRSGS